MSGQRHCVRPRCADCGLHPVICVCEQRPEVSLPFSLLIVQHRRELHKPTNSVRPLRKVLQDTELVHYAVRGETFDAGPLTRSNRRYCLLFPESPEAPAPRTVEKVSRGDTLVVLDGTWAQCTRMRKKIEALQSMATVSLQVNAASAWGIRHTLDPNRLSTFEAVTAAIRQSGYEEQANRMLGYFCELAKRMQLMRGTARPSETGLSAETYQRYIQEVNTPRPEHKADD